MTRVVYAGIPITVGEKVLVIDASPRRPVFHREDCHSHNGGFILPYKHVKRYARPCLRCWPELRGQAELELKEGVL